MKDLRKIANKTYPKKETFFDPNGDDAKRHNKILLQAMCWVTHEIVKINTKKKKKS